MIFRRRTTEQVYSTLQQVQRRMSEQGGQATPAIGSGGTRPYTAGGTRTTPQAAIGTPLPLPLRFPTPPPGATPALVPNRTEETEAGAGTPLGGMLAQNPPSAGRFSLQLPLHLAITLMLLWLVTVILAFVLGRMSADRAPAPIREAPPAAPVAATPAEVSDRGRFLFLLKAVPTTGEQLRQEWQKTVDQLNDACRRNAAKGWKPYFALREPENGGMQLIFGSIDGRLGIDQAKFTDFARLLSQPVAKQGAGYTQGRWLPVDP